MMVAEANRSNSAKTLAVPANPSNGSAIVADTKDYASGIVS